MLNMEIHTVCHVEILVNIAVISSLQAGKRSGLYTTNNQAELTRQ